MPTCLELALGFVVVVASDKLFYWLFQHQPDRILPLLPDLPADARGYRFSAPVLKERPELPALILEAQMAADAGFLRRLYAETARLVQAASWAVQGALGRVEGLGRGKWLRDLIRQQAGWRGVLPSLAAFCDFAFECLWVC